MFDPARLKQNPIPPPVYIEELRADRKDYPAGGFIHLPAHSRDLEIGYTALSFSNPEKVRFRYKLDGRDQEWQDAGTRRRAYYTDLAPRQYRFRVRASNNSGVWNETGDSLEFSIAPTYYQTNWFLASCVAAFLALLAGLYRLRLLYLTKQFNARLEGRVSERTRVARDLHDTLLQSFQGVLLQFHAVGYLLPDRPEAVKKLEAITEQARAAITEGRDAVQGLRSSTVVTNDLARSLTIAGEGLVAELSSTQSGQNRPDFRVQVEGKSRDLPPIIRDEVYRIACEALRNAFRHAHAKRIEVEIHYEQRNLRLRVRDDGKGIDPKVLDGGGRAGHHGLPGMHERAQLAGGKLAVWSEPGSGTEIELTIPRSVAYAKSPVANQAMTSGQRTG
jgi:signal transduction histidine kinase